MKYPRRPAVIIFMPKDLFTPQVNILQIEIFVNSSGLDLVMVYIHEKFHGTTDAGGCIKCTETRGARPH